MKTKDISLTDSEMLGLITNLSTMLHAGIPIYEVVNTLLDDIKGNQRKMLLVMRDDISQGRRVYESFARFPQVFNNVSINIIKAAEEAGGLDKALTDIKNQTVKNIEFKDKIMSALLYPMVVIFVMGGMLILILIVVVPRISQVFSRLQIALPLPTRILLFTSDLLLKNTIPTLTIATTVIVVGYLLWKKNKNLIVQPLTGLPIVSDLVRQIDLTIFARSLSALLTSGIPITTALELSENVVIRKDIARAIAVSRKMIMSGKRLSEGLKSYKSIIPSLMIKIIETGEKSGSLEGSLLEIADYLDYQVTTDLRRVTALLEPLMLVVVGVLIGGVMMSIIAPIYGLIGQVGAH